MYADRLLAKSRRRNECWHDSMLLSVHLTDVHRAACEILDVTGRDQLVAMGLSADKYASRLRQIVLLAAALHDLGKANNHFQEMLSGRRTLQSLRHEWITVLMICRPEWRRWLKSAVANEADLDIVGWVIGGHHPAYNRPSPPQRAQEGGGAEIRLLMGHPDFVDCVGSLATLFPLSPPPVCQDEAIAVSETAADGAFARIGRWFGQAEQLRATLDDESCRLVAVAKTCLIAADVAGSALPRAGKDPAWISRAFTCVPPKDDLEQIVAGRLDGNSLRPFQSGIATQGNRVILVRAACGSGKTVAAYQWAATQCPNRRIYFCYPTTGTATEGYRDYLFDKEAQDAKFGARLFHGRADVDLDVILGTGRDDDADGAAGINRLQSLDAWSTPIVSCTVDTVLGLVQNHRKGLYAWPALAQSAFVFDEIHAYDEKLFGALLRFLQAVRGVRVLLMTASLPQARLAALHRCLSKQREELVEVTGPPELEQLPRYHRLVPADPHDPLPEVRAEIARGGKVLWVCNRVDRAITIATHAADLNPLVYHSRFRYEDRVIRHKEVIDAFDSSTNASPALAICTQVAEMSLDLSATLLVTDLAPVPAMIQRLGRLNRRALPCDPRVKPVTMPFVAIEAIGENGDFVTLPYGTEPEMYGDWPTASREWLVRLGPGAISQSDLALAWESAESFNRVRPCNSKWLDGGPRTEVDTLREGSPGITVILATDLADVQSRKKRFIEVALPMPPVPRGLPWREWKDFKGIPVAPADVINYDPQLGGAWRR